MLVINVYDHFIYIYSSDSGLILENLRVALRPSVGRLEKVDLQQLPYFGRFLLGCKKGTKFTRLNGTIQVWIT